MSSWWTSSSKVVSMEKNRAAVFLLSQLRNQDTNTEMFKVYSDRLFRLLSEEALCRLPSVSPSQIRTPCGIANGLERAEDDSQLCLVSIIRAADGLVEAARSLEPSSSVGKILIQREKNAHGHLDHRLYYQKLPANLQDMFVILMDPMLGTGRSVLKALEVLTSRGARADRLMLVNVVSSREGIENVHQSHPNLPIVTACVDEELDHNKFIVPGLGDFGDRYYGTID